MTEQEQESKHQDFTPARMMMNADYIHKCSNAELFWFAEAATSLLKQRMLEIDETFAREFAALKKEIGIKK